MTTNDSEPNKATGSRRRAVVNSLLDNVIDALSEAVDISERDPDTLALQRIVSDVETIQSRDGQPREAEIAARLRSMDRDRQAIMKLAAADDDRLQRCMRMVGCDLVASQDDFETASELSGLPEATHQALQTDGAGDRV